MFHSRSILRNLHIINQISLCSRPTDLVWIQPVMKDRCALDLSLFFCSANSGSFSTRYCSASVKFWLPPKSSSTLLGNTILKRMGKPLTSVSSFNAPLRSHWNKIFSQEPFRIEYLNLKFTHSHFLTTGCFKIVLWSLQPVLVDE